MAECLFLKMTLDLNDGNLLLDVLGHTGAVLAQALRVDHAVEGVRGDAQREGDILRVAQHAHILHYVILWEGAGEFIFQCVCQHLLSFSLVASLALSTGSVLMSFSPNSWPSTRPPAATRSNAYNKKE